MNEKIAELREWALISNVAAFLRVIRSGETNQDDSSFRMMFGGEMFQSFKDHPRKVITKKLGGKEYSSSAAGAYQFLSRTWDSLVAQYGFPDFSPEYQHLGAIALIKGRKALDAVIAGRFDEAIRLCGKEWASLPGSPYGQPTKTLAQARAVYEKYGGTYAGSSNPIVLPTVKPMAPIVIPILTSLLSKLPEIAGFFGSGSEVSNRNLAAGKVIADTLVQATNSVNLQEAAEKIESDTAALTAARDALAVVLPTITEAGGGGIEGARKFAAASAGQPIWTPHFIIALVLLALITFVVVAVMLKFPWLQEVTSETRAGAIMFVLGSFGGALIGFYYGQTASQSKRAGDK